MLSLHSWSSTFPSGITGKAFFSISFRADFLSTNSSRKFLYSWEWHYVCWIQNYVLTILFFQHFRDGIHCLLTSIVSENKSTVIQITIFSIWNMSFFQVGFQIFFPLSWISAGYYMCRTCHSVFSIWKFTELCESLNVCVLSNLEHFQPLCLQIHYCTPIYLSFHRCINEECFTFWYLLPRLLTLLIFEKSVYTFSLCSSDWIIFLALSSSSLALFSHLYSTIILIQWIFKFQILC